MATHSSILGLENTMDRGACWATVHGVTKSQTWLNDWYTFFYAIYCSSPFAFKVFSLCLIVVNLIYISILACSSLGPCCMALFVLLYLSELFLSHVRGFFSYKIFKYFLISFFFPISSISGTPIMWMLVHLVLSQKSLILSPFLFFLLFFSFSVAVISTTLFSNSLIHSSALVILLLITSLHFFPFSYCIVLHLLIH